MATAPAKRAAAHVPCPRHAKPIATCADCTRDFYHKAQVNEFLKKPKREVTYAKPVFTVAQLKEKFAKFDTDRNGLLTQEELKAVLMSSGMDEKSASENCIGFFKMADVDNSGSVSYKEYLTEYIRMQNYKFLRSIQSKFQETDANGDGQIQKPELLKVLVEHLGAEEAAAQIDAMFAAMDTDRSGGISLKEMAAWYYKKTNDASERRTPKVDDFSLSLPIPIALLTDSYKASHFLMYPAARMMAAYGEFREPYNKDRSDTRFVFYGIRYIIDNYISRRWTIEDVNKAEAFYRTHNAGNTPFPFPKELFLKFIAENDGYFPVRIEALPEGTVANTHVPVYQIFANGEYSRLVTFMETLLTQVWYPTCVATLSRRSRELIDASFNETVDEELGFLAEGRLHDFGFRGTTCVEQSVLGGAAHLLNFTGTDTMSAAYYVQYHLNGGRPIATSIPASEHSVMTSWPSERQAIRNMIDKFGGDGKVFSVVMDSYDYVNALTKVIPSIAAIHTKTGGLMVMRPDSGDPVECILQALRAGEKAVGVTINKKGYKMLKGLACIQGDGIGIDTIKAILEAIKVEKYSAANVAFGMGGGLLQKCNRDTMAFATKLNIIVYQDGSVREVMKKPKTDGGKVSFPGLVKVRRVNGNLTIFPRGLEEKVDAADNELKVVYDCRPIPGVWDDFDTIKVRVAQQWRACPKTYDPISEEMKKKVAAWIADFDVTYARMLASGE